MGDNRDKYCMYCIGDTAITVYNSSEVFVCSFLPDLDFFFFFFGLDGSAAASCCRRFASSSSCTWHSSKSVFYGLNYKYIGREN